MRCPQSLWRLVHNGPRDDGSRLGKGAQQQQSLELHAAENELSMSELPLESQKSLVEQTVNALDRQGCNTASGTVAGLEAEVQTVSKELTALRLHVENLQSELLHEIEQRVAAETALCGELTSGMKELHAIAIGLSTAEAKQQQVASSMMERCTHQTELQLREHVTRLEMEIAGTMDQAHEAARELRKTGARLEREMFDIMDQALRKTSMRKGVVANLTQPNQITVDGSCDPLVPPVGTDPGPVAPPLPSLQSPHFAAGKVPPGEPALEKNVDGIHRRLLSTMGKPESRGSTSSFWMEYMLDRNV